MKLTDEWEKWYTANFSFPPASEMKLGEVEKAYKGNLFIPACERDETHLHVVVRQVDKLFIPACERDETISIPLFKQEVNFSFPPASEMKHGVLGTIGGVLNFSFPPASEMKHGSRAPPPRRRLFIPACERDETPPPQPEGSDDLFIPACERDETNHVNEPHGISAFSFPPASEMKRSILSATC